MKQTNNIETWNTGIQFFRQIADRKDLFLIAETEQEFKKAISVLSNELDLIYAIIVLKNNSEKKRLDNLRKHIDNLDDYVHRKDEPKVIDVRRRIRKIRRIIYDLEGKYEINFPIETAQKYTEPQDDILNLM